MTETIASTAHKLGMYGVELDSDVAGYPETNNHTSGEHLLDLAGLSADLDRSLFTESQNPFLFPLHLLGETPKLSSDGVTTVGADQTEEVAAENSRPGIADRGDIAGGDEQDPHWWLIHTKPRQEKKLAQELRQLEIPHYLPTSKCKAVTRGRTRVTQVPQFPSYLFLNGTPDERRRALQTNRIVATHPVADQETLRQQLWELADLIEKGTPLTVESRFAPGIWVRVKAGLLKGKEGEVIKRGGKTRLFVFVNELLGGVSLEIEQHLLESYGSRPIDR